MPFRSHYNRNQPRVPKGQAHGGEWTRVGAEGIRADTDPTHDTSEPTVGDLGISGYSESTHDASELTVADRGIRAESGRGVMAVLPLRMFLAAVMRAEAQRAAAALALREAARSGQLGNPGTSLGAVPPYSRTEVPRGTAADEAVLERFEFFNALSQRNSAEQVAVLEFRAGEYKRTGDLPVTRVRVLSREQVEQFCRHLPTVQKVLNDAVKIVDEAEPGLRNSNPALFGTYVHAAAAAIIKAMGRTDLDAEVYWLDGEKGRGLGSVGMDAQEKPPNNKELFCIYDHKTGRAGLSPKRMLVLAAKAYGEGRTHIVVIQVRPTASF